MTLLSSDRKLLDSFRKGENWAIERVYYAYVDQVAGLLRNGFSFMSGGQPAHFQGYPDAFDLECAVQDTFIQAFSPSARQAYDGIKPFGPYLMTIARNRVITTLRSEQRERRRRSSLASEGVLPQPTTPERETMRRELEELVERFRNSLPRDLLTLYELRFVNDMNLMDAARAMEITRMKARILEQKLRRRFLDFLNKRGFPGLASGGLGLALALLSAARPGGGS